MESRDTDSPPTKVPIRRVIGAMLVPPVSLTVIMGGLGTYFAVAHGLRGDEIGAAIEPFVAIPVLLNFAVIAIVTLTLMRRDGRTLGSIGWDVSGVSAPIEAAIGVGLGLVIAVVNQFAIFPLIAALPQMGAAPFDPTLGTLSLPMLLIVMPTSALVEDTLYRGYGITQLSKRFPVGMAVLITALMHALFTFSSGPVIMGWHVLLALALAGVFLWRNNLFAVVACHVTFGLAPRLLTHL